MLDVISVENMRRSDAYTIASFVSSEELMRRAAQGIFDLVAGRIEDFVHKNVAIVVGSGNNGGDGFALAEILLCQGAKSVNIYSIATHYSADAEFYMKRVLEVGGSVGELLDDSLVGADVVVDCLLGTGFKGEVRDTYKRAVSLINASREQGAYVVSADINSGLNGDTGEATCAVVSDLTVTIGYHKTGILLARGGEYVNEVVVAPIGIVLLQKENYLLDDEEWKEANYPIGQSFITLEDGTIYFRGNV